MKKLTAFLLAAMLASTTSAATFNIFGPATGILKGSATSPITTAAAWSDVQVLLTGTCNSSVFVRGDGTCVAVSLTAGVSGTLPVANGGTNLTAATDDTVMVGNGTTWQAKALTDCDGASSAVTYDVTTNAWGCNTISTISGAALTKTNDTNVTLTLGGSPTTALVNAASITAGWTGTLAAGRGGTGVSSLGNLTKTDDTNVTLTLGGTPTGALITSTSITAGWTGTLAAARGGLGMSTVTDDTLAVANGTTWESKALANCTDTGGNHLNYSTSTNAFSCGTSSSATVSGANPSASVGLSAVNGSATTYLRSDGAPALSQSIAPTWTGVHLFNGSTNTSSVGTTGASIGARNSNTIPAVQWTRSAATSNNKIWEAIANTDDTFAMRSLDDAFTATKDFLKATRSGNAITALSFGNATDNPTYSFLGTGATTFGGATTFNGTGDAVIVNGAVGHYALQANSSTTTGSGYGAALTAGTNSSDNALLVRSAATGNRTYFLIRGDGVTTFGNTTDNPTYSFLGTGATTFGGSIAATTGSLSAASGSLTVNSSTSSNAALALFNLNGSNKARFGAEGTSGATITGSIAGDAIVYGTTGVAFTGNSGGQQLRLNGTTAALEHADGSASSPPMTFASDTNTGVYSAGADSLGISAGGTNRVTVASTTALTVTGVANNNAMAIAAPNTASQAYGLSIAAGTNSTDYALYVASAGGTERMRLFGDGGLTIASPTGGDQGAGTVNATGLYVNGVSVSGGAQTSATFTGTFTGVSGSVTCTMKYRKTGSAVALFVNSGSSCTGSSNASTLTMTGVPAAIQPSFNSGVPCMLIDNGQDVNGACVMGTAGTMTMYMGSPLTSTGFTASGTKGFGTATIIYYDLKN